MASQTSAGTGQAVNLDGVSPFSLKDRAAFLGLELEYVPPSQGLFTETQCASIVRRLEQVEYTEVVTKNAKGAAAAGAGAAPAYAWFADRGEWVLVLEKAQENALVPFAHADWLRGIGWSIFERMKSFHNTGTGFVGGGNAALVTWIRGPDVVPQKRLGENCPNWFSDYPMTTVYMFFADGKDDNVGTLSVSFSPGTDVASRKFFASEDKRKGNVPLASALNLRLCNGSILVVRDEKSHRHWDFSVASGSSGYLVAFQTVAAVHVHQEHNVRPPVRSKRGLSLQRRLVPAHEREPDQPQEEEEEEEKVAVATKPTKRSKTAMPTKGKGKK